MDPSSNLSKAIAMLILFSVFFTKPLSCSDSKITNRGYFWHITDIHYDHTYETSQLSCKENVFNPGRFGNSLCDSPWHLVENSIQSMAAIKRDVDFILWTGDTVAHADDAKLTAAKKIEIVENVTTLFTKIFPNSVSLIPALGNNDFYPTDQADITQDEIYGGTSKIWTEWIENTIQIQKFKSGGFYHKLIHPKVRIVVLNTNMYYTCDNLTHGVSDPAGQFQWMREILEQSRTYEEKVIIVAHLPPGIWAPYMDIWFYPHHHEQFIDILTSYADIIVASHYGHEHTDSFRILVNTQNESKAIPQFTSPSVTPRIDYEAHNSGIRLVEYDRETGRHINYIQYYMNVTEANYYGAASWKPLYSFSDAYGVSDMGVDSLRSIFSRMKGDNGEVLAQKYFNFLYVHNDSLVDFPDVYRWAIACGGHMHDKEAASKCIDTHKEMSFLQYYVKQAFYLLVSVMSLYAIFSIPKIF